MKLLNWSLFCELHEFKIIKYIYMLVLLSWLRNGHSPIAGQQVIIETEFFPFAFLSFPKWQKELSVPTHSSSGSFHSCFWKTCFYLSSYQPGGCVRGENGMRWRDSREVEQETQDNTAQHWFETPWRSGSCHILSGPRRYKTLREILFLLPLRGLSSSAQEKYNLSYKYHFKIYI